MSKRDGEKDNICIIGKDRIVQYIEQIAITKTVYTFGDEWLYRMSRQALKSKDVYDIASMIWLIGRSYSASPERQINKAFGSDNKIEPADLFCDYATVVRIFLIKNEEKVKEYTYDNTEKDIDIIYSMNELILQLNKLRINVSHNDNTENIISFCSKFLHFCFPKSIFIYDQYSLCGGNRLFEKIMPKTKNKAVEKNIYVKDFCLDELIEIYSQAKSEKEKVCTGNVEDDTTGYINHAVRCYSLAKFINDNNISSINIYDDVYSIPRLVDSILLKIGCAKDCIHND